jgi:group I intron endonuclease
MIGYIYILRCPMDQQVKYVGLTTNPNKRKNQHRCYSESAAKNHGYNSWKKSLMCINERPIFEIIEECEIELMSQREIFWISFYKKEFELLNLTEGGEYNLISENHNSKFLKGKKLEDYYGLQKANEIRQKIGLKGEKNPNYGGKNCTDVWRERQRESQSKKHLLVFDGSNFVGKFKNSKDLAKFLNCSPSTIREGKRNGWLIKGIYRVINEKDLL